MGSGKTNQMAFGGGRQSDHRKKQTKIKGARLFTQCYHMGITNMISIFHF